MTGAGTAALRPFIVKNDRQINDYKEDTYGLPSQAGRGKSRGGQHEPTNLREKLAMEEVMTNPAKGMSLEGKNTDPRWPAEEGWEKWVQNVNGIEIHYQYNPITGEFDDVKIK